MEIYKLGIDDQVLLKSACLIASNSPKQAFYTIWIEQANQAFRVCKASGAGGCVWHRKEWEFDSLDAAEALFLKRLRQKTNPTRRSQRRYRLDRLLE